MNFLQRAIDVREVGSMLFQSVSDLAESSDLFKIEIRIGFASLRKAALKTRLSQTNLLVGVLTILHQRLWDRNDGSTTSQQKSDPSVVKLVCGNREDAVEKLSAESERGAGHDRMLNEDAY